MPKPSPNFFKNTLKGRHWGNVAENSPSAVFEHWTSPDISNPSAIVEHFPVVLTKIRKDGKEGYRVTWHLANLKEWRNTRPETWDEFQDYEDYVTARLRYALALHGEDYKLIPTERADELFRFLVHKRSVKNTRKNTKNEKKASPRNTTRNAPASILPKLFLLNDIKNFFPVVWHKDPRNPKLLGIQFHRMKLQTEAKQASIPINVYEQAMTAKLIQTLKESEGTGAWQVLPSMSKEYVCMLRLLK